MTHTIVAPNPTCPRVDQLCPTDFCRGATEPALCDHWHRLTAWRSVRATEQVVRIQTARQIQLDPRVRDAVNACSDRGGVLPISQQADCGCHGREWTECRAGHGIVSGKVTLSECLECQTTRLAQADLA